MAHTFDHGLAKPLRTLVREGVIARLAPLLIASGGYLQMITTLGSVVRGNEDVDGIGFLFDALSGRAPAAAVTIGDESSSPAGVGGYQYRGTLDVHVYVVTNNLRTREARQAADVVALADVTKDPGVDIMLEHVSELLIGYQVPSSAAPKGQQILELRPRAQQELVNNNQIAIWDVAFTVDVSREIDEHRDITVALASVYTFNQIGSTTVVETHTEIT